MPAAQPADETLGGRAVEGRVAVLHQQLALVQQQGVRVDDVLLQHGGGGDHFPDGARRILPLDRLVQQREERVGGNIQEVLDVDRAGETRIIVTGIADQRQDFAAARIHGDDDALLRDGTPSRRIELLQLINQRLAGEGLQVGIDREAHVVARRGIDLTNDLDHFAGDIDFAQDGAALASQPRFQVALDAFIADAVKGGVVTQSPQLGGFFRRDGAHIAHDMRGQGAGGVFAHRDRLHADAGHIDALFQDLHRHQLRHVQGDDDGPEGFDAFAFFHQVLNAARPLTRLFRDFARWRHADQSRQAIEDVELGRFVAGQPRWNDGHVVGRHVERQALVVAVEDCAAPRGDGQAAEAILVGDRLEFVVAQDLQFIHAQAEDQKYGEDHRLEEGQAPGLKRDKAVGFHSRALISAPSDENCGAIGKPPSSRLCARRTKA